MKLLEYLPFALGCLVGVVLAFLVTALLAISDPGRLLVFAFLPALGGAIAERVRARP